MTFLFSLIGGLCLWLLGQYLEQKLGSKKKAQLDKSIYYLDQGGEGEKYEKQANH